MKVFLLATVRKPELLPFTTLVFKTLRVGFPTALVGVFINHMAPELNSVIRKECEAIGASCSDAETIHHEWILYLTQIEEEPFFICDTDVIFYENFERFKFDGPLAGYRVPEWNDAFSGAITRARLHTSLLYINPMKVSVLVKEYLDKIADTPFTPKVNLINPLVIPFKSKPYFYDTCSLLYHAIGGQSFTDEQKDAYCHINFGTIPDLVLPRLPKDKAEKIQARRDLLLSYPDLGRGEWLNQDEYYLNHPV